MLFMHVSSLICVPSRYLFDYVALKSVWNAEILWPNQSCVLQIVCLPLSLWYVILSVVFDQTNCDVILLTQNDARYEKDNGIILVYMLLLKY